MILIVLAAVKKCHAVDFGYYLISHLGWAHHLNYSHALPASPRCSLTRFILEAEPSGAESISCAHTGIKGQISAPAELPMQRNVTVVLIRHFGTSSS